MQSKFMTPVSDALNAYVHALAMFWKWFLGTDVRRLKSLLLPVPRTALVANVAKQLAPLTS